MSGVKFLPADYLLVIGHNDEGCKRIRNECLKTWPLSSSCSPHELVAADGDAVGLGGKTVESGIVAFASDCYCGAVVDAKFISTCYRLLREGSSLSVHMELAPAIFDTTVQQLERSISYAGFIDQSVKSSGIYFNLKCSKPNWILGTGIRPGEELVDENSLIEEDGGEVTPYVPFGKGREACATQPKACANCTCGRAEVEKKVGVEQAKLQLEEGGVRSSCGNCYRGDAFRCAGCPYKGKPAFRPGEKIALDDPLVQPETPLGVAADVNVTAGGGVVKLVM